MAPNSPRIGQRISTSFGKCALPGVGWSQPVVWDDKIFITTAEAADQPKPDPNNRGPGVSGFAMLFGGASQEPPKAIYRWKVLCLDAATGETVWEKLAREGRPTIKIHANNTYASETPATDGERIDRVLRHDGRVLLRLGRQSALGEGPRGVPDAVRLGHRQLARVARARWFTSNATTINRRFSSRSTRRRATTGVRVEREEKSNWSTPYLGRTNYVLSWSWPAAVSMPLVRSEDRRPAVVDEGNGRTATTPIGSEELLYVDSYDRLTGDNGIFAAIRPGAIGRYLPERQ